MLRLGLDLHGVVDAYPQKFALLGEAVRNSGGSVYIITGASQELAMKQISDLKIGHEFYDIILSITDHLKSRGIPFIQNDDGGIRVDDEIWDKVKSEMVKELKIDLHIDDSPVYGKYFEPGIYLKFNEREKR